MKYAHTKNKAGIETVVIVLPLSTVPDFDPNKPQQPDTYGVADEVEVGWVKQLDGSFTPPSITLDMVKAAKAEELNLACQSQIYAGYISDALGGIYHYPAKLTDQANMVASVTSSLYPNLDTNWTTLFWCMDTNNVWSYKPHTVSQIQKAGADGKAAILAALSKNVSLQELLSAAETVKDAESINWD